MTKSLIYTDIHWGVRKNSQVFIDNNIRFVEKVLLPTIDMHGIKHIINCGDLFDDRSSTDTNVVDTLKRVYFDELRSRGVVEDLIIGNHDTYFRHSNVVNSPKAVLGEYIESGTLRVFDSVHESETCLYVPWITKDNADATFDAIRNSKKKYCFGHLELAGFKLYRGKDCKEGIDRAPFEKFMFVGSGHFHFPSKQGQIHYLGAPTEHTWQDCGDVRGCYIFDHDTMELEFIRNPYSMFEVVTYENKHDQATIERCRGKIVKLYYGNVDKESAFDKFRKEINSVALKLATIRSSIDVTIVEPTEEQTLIEVEDTVTLIRNNVKSANPEVIDEMVHLYHRAQASMHND